MLSPDIPARGPSIPALPAPPVAAPEMAGGSISGAVSERRTNLGESSPRQPLHIGALQRRQSSNLARQLPISAHPEL